VAFGGVPEPRKPLAWRIGLQAALLLGLAAAACFGVRVAANNLAQRHVVSGFDFLGRTAGFDIVQHLIPYDSHSTFGRAFVVGLLNTILMAAVGIVLASGVGVLIAAGRLSGNWLLGKLASGYVELFRNIPPLLQLLFWYFAVLRALPPPRGSFSFAGVVLLNNRGLYIPWPDGSVGGAPWFGLLLLAAGLGAIWRRPRTGGAVACAGLALAALTVHWDVPHPGGFNIAGGMVVIPEFAALALSLTLYHAAYVAEAIRAGVAGVDSGQVDAARSLGLTGTKTFHMVILPQALRLVLPPLTTIWLNLIKGTAIAAAIAYPDVMSVFAGTVLNLIGQSVEIMTLVNASYIVLCLAVAFMLNRAHRALLRT
jgi:general L-amino acid transport system permease protein